jgi:hypothetical protein
MKTQLLVAAALLFSASAFAQTAEKAKNEQGTTVSTVAKADAQAGTKGETVSGAATLKSQASVHRQNESAEERQQKKADRKAERDTRKQENKDFVAGVKAENEARIEGKSEEAKAEAEARKVLILEKKETAKEAREEAKADRKKSDDAVLKADAKSILKADRAEKKGTKADRPVKVRTGGKVGADVKINRPRVGAKVKGSAGLGLGIN